MRETEIDTLIRLFSRLPGFGRRSARRVVLHLIKKKETQLIPLADAIQNVIEHVRICPVCGNLDSQSPCSICSDERRDENVICVVQDVADLWAIERSAAFRGRYHVLGGLLSAIEGTGPDELRLPVLEQRLRRTGVSELILALPATVDGQTTGHYIIERFKDLPVKISSLAQGIPVGGELDYLDDGTIQTALKSRR
ncbi:MAG: recombination protein RecR [Alphaproteobacteria bacterium]|mgnify:FL=1|nr:recombination protein RecR [Alphaproteobacteria bacterium]MBQ8347052.1 recombination protein RecR [Alphaproteobacteria bacterium]